MKQDEKKNICVFCSSSEAINNIYFEKAEELAHKIIENKYTLVFGGADVGLMRKLAETVREHNGYAIGVIPQRILDNKLACKKINELIVTPDMNTRKAKLAELADAFIALPGGFGTLEELSEVITAKQLGYHNKPVIILNINGFYDNLLKFFETLYLEKVAKSDYRKIYFVTNSIENAFKYIEEYSPFEAVKKWF
ncbi:MAG: TIGR00730 family Rossman fold protein [Bacteroidales bacterium]|nr:TIGR00730 family Rossman fold protein [Bacteroidales bacterium]